jgi:hypothetical protein
MTSSGGISPLPSFILALNHLRYSPPEAIAGPHRVVKGGGDPSIL